MSQQELARAWQRRGNEEACRVFHGPGEGTGALADVAIDRFGENAWVTLWNSAARSTLPEVSTFLQQQGLKSAVVLDRPERGVPEDPETLFGEPPREQYAVSEGKFKIWIRLLGVKHPGLFLDHAPLRRWLESNASGLRVLNTFAYTGSLSLAAAAGGASHVTTLDLSKATIDWAQENWKLNGFSDESGRFIYGDVFEWLPRLKRAGERYDAVILDPPSFSRGKKGTFSTARDLEKLHALALDLLADEGWLITSINSANVSRDQYEEDVGAAACALGFRLSVEEEIHLPPSFPAKRPEDDYLKGWILRAVRS